MKKPLNRLMNSQTAHRLGEILRVANTQCKEAGDAIDQGLILRRVLDEGGFELREKVEPSTTPKVEPSDTDTIWCDNCKRMSTYQGYPTCPWCKHPFPSSGRR